jgi:hypothetical protein
MVSDKLELGLGRTEVSEQFSEELRSYWSTGVMRAFRPKNDAYGDFQYAGLSVTRYLDIIGPTSTSSSLIRR